MKGYVTVTSRRRARLRRDSAHLLARVNTMLGSVEGVMLYGSTARGSAGARSDVDVLAVVRQRPRSEFDGELAVTAYLPGHLHAMAERGSLFVLHLRHDGIILHDPTGILADALAAYRSPADCDRLATVLTVVAQGLLAATPVERASLGPAMRSLAFYVLRSAVYDACVRHGEPQFDCVRAVEQLGLPHLASVFEERRRSYSGRRLDRVLVVLPLVLPGCDNAIRSGLAATAVAVADSWPLASDLLAGVVAGHSVDYTALSLPPV